MGTLKDSWNSPEIKKKLLFTFLIISVLSLLTIIPIPGLNHYTAINTIREWGSLGTILNTLSCGALSNAAITSLGIYPFLVASIIMQVLTLAVPKLRNMAQLGEEGSKVITKYTRIASIAMAVIFGALYCIGMKGAVTSKLNFWLAIVLCGLSVAIGSAFCGWCVELLNNKGIGDGLTIIIVAGIIHNIPRDVVMLYFDAESVNVYLALGFMILGILLMIGMLFLVLLINMGEKKLRIIFSKRTVGMKQFGMQNQVLPLKVTQAGIMPIIYAMTFILLIPSILTMIAPESDNLWFTGAKNFPTSLGFIPLYVVLVVAFAFIFSMMQFNPYEISSQIKQNGGYIQGIKPGKPTAQYLMSVFSNLNSADCAFLILVTVIPMAVNFIPSVNGIAFDGVGLVLVGGGFIEMKTLLDNALKAEEEKLKQAGKDKKRKNYNKK